MTPQADFLNLRKFDLQNSGDARERSYWPQVCSLIPGYETFWREFVILLTERIDPNAPAGSVRLRTNLPEPYERLLMANYSTFTAFAATVADMHLEKTALQRGDLLQPEVFFFQACRCLDMYKELRSHVAALFTKRGISVRFGVVSERSDARIRRYRNVFTHDAYLGRGNDHGRELVVSKDHLPTKGTPLLWSKIATYPKNEMVRLDDLQEQICKELASVLEPTWQSLTRAGTELRVMDDFLEDTGLLTMLPIGASAQPTASVPISASGTNFY
jgi:hypothetical protein